MSSPATPVVRLDPFERRELAQAAEVCERTFLRALAGKPVKPLCLRRIRRALAAANMAHLLPDGAAVQ